MYEPGNDAMHKEIGQKLRELPVGKKYVITIKQHRDVRSLPQNRYYRVVLTLISAQTGQGTGDRFLDQDMLHDIFKKKFNGEMVYFPKSGSEVVGGSTASMDSKEFTMYINRIKKWAEEEYGLIIPEQKDMTYAQWMQIETDYDETFSGL